MIITIDGPAGTGKSTVAQRFADKIGFTYFDTGALYRAISWQILELGICHIDETTLAPLLQEFSFTIQTIAGKKRYFIRNKDITEAIRSGAVTAIVSEVAACKNVRAALKPIQIDFSKKTDVIFEGRDLGTAVFPDADLKFFLSAQPVVRAQRRYRELIDKFPDQAISYDAVLKEIEERDALDRSREHAPLKQAQDAIFVDTSHLTVDEVATELQKIYVEKKR